jgi:hypothetical protein
MIVIPIATTSLAYERLQAKQKSSKRIDTKNTEKQYKEQDFTTEFAEGNKVSGDAAPP